MKKRYAVVDIDPKLLTMNKEESQEYVNNLFREMKRESIALMEEFFKDPANISALTEIRERE